MELKEKESLFLDRQIYITGMYVTGKQIDSIKDCIRKFENQDLYDKLFGIEDSLKNECKEAVINTLKNKYNELLDMYLNYKPV